MASAAQCHLILDASVLQDCKDLWSSLLANLLWLPFWGQFISLVEEATL